MAGLDVKTPDTPSRHVNPRADIIRHEKVASTALTDAIARDNLSPWSKSSFKMYGLIAITGLINCMSGYDGTLMSSVNAMDPFHDQFGTSMSGSGTGLIFSIYAIGQLFGSLVGAPASDTFGRRFGMFTGSVFSIAGAIIEVVAPNIGQFIGGRFLLGFGVAITNLAGPVYLVEIALPHWRGTFGGLSHVVGYYIGGLACTWVSYGTGHMASGWSWKIPTLIQLLPSATILVFSIIMPESPRWLYANNKKEKGRRVLIKYHGGGNPDSAIVAFEAEQIERDLESEESGVRKWWDYRMLFSSRDMLYRLWLLFLVSVFSQFIGGSVISYYMPTMLENAGITDSSQQLLMNAINVLLSMCSGIIGSFFVDRWGRRNLFLWGTFLTGLVYIPINVIASYPANQISTSMGYGFIACIFTYGIFFSFCWTPLQSLYPAEILPNRVRAKGMAFQGIASSAANFVNLYATSTGLRNIGWRMYTIFLVLHFAEFILMWLTLPETKNRSIEDLDHIFEARNPVKASLQKEEVVIHVGVGAESLEKPC